MHRYFGWNARVSEALGFVSYLGVRRPAVTFGVVWLWGSLGVFIGCCDRQDAIERDYQNIGI